MFHIISWVFSCVYVFFLFTKMWNFQGVNLFLIFLFLSKYLANMGMYLLLDNYFPQATQSFELWQNFIFSARTIWEHLANKTFFFFFLISGSGDLQRCGSRFFPRGMGMAGPVSEGFIQRCHVGELQELGMAW